jgi:hypothetical protein
MVSNKMILTLMIIAVTALAGCSDDNPVTPMTLVDTAPPAVPANVSVDHNSTGAVINWDMSTVDTDLAGYIVIRERDGVSDTLVGTPALISSYEDANPLSGYSEYHIYAVDHAGNQSAIASVGLVVTLGHQSADLNQ